MSDNEGGKVIDSRESHAGSAPLEITPEELLAMGELGLTESITSEPEEGNAPLVEFDQTDEELIALSSTIFFFTLKEARRKLPSLAAMDDDQFSAIEYTILDRLERIVTGLEQRGESRRLVIDDSGKTQRYAIERNPRGIVESEVEIPIIEKQTPRREGPLARKDSEPTEKPKERKRVARRPHVRLFPPDRLMRQPDFAALRATFGVLALSEYDDLPLEINLQALYDKNRDRFTDEEIDPFDFLDALSFAHYAGFFSLRDTKKRVDPTEGVLSQLYLRFNKKQHEQIMAVRASLREVARSNLAVMRRIAAYRQRTTS